MAVVAPHGVLFRGGTEGQIRKKLVEENLIDAVIGLPEKLFYGTGIPAAILVLRKNKKDRNILFVDASREFDSGKNQNQLSEKNVAKIVQTCKARKSIEKYAYLATPEEVAENEYNLNIPRYVNTFEEQLEIDLTTVRAEGRKLRAQLADLDAQMTGYLKELGYGS
jgi:type I restriction enzyme M protein